MSLDDVSPPVTSRNYRPPARLTDEHVSVLLAILDSPTPYATIAAGRMLHPDYSKPAQYARGRHVLRWLAKEGAVAPAQHGRYVLTERGRIACALLMAKGWTLRKGRLTRPDPDGEGTMPACPERL